MFTKPLSIELVEPVVYLRGHPKDKHTVNILRGLVKLQLLHPVLVRSVTIQFVGTAKTMWPEANQQWDKNVLVDTVIPISRMPVTLKKGIHVFPFEILLSNALSESVECGLGHVRYKLLCHVHIKRTWSFLSTSLKAQRPVTLVRLPKENGPRCITQTHNLDGNELNILVESAHITPGSPLALSFSFDTLPMSIDQLDVRLIERQKFSAKAKHATRVLHHEITLLPINKQQPFFINERDEIRCVFGVPDKETLRVHPSTSNSSIRVRHWIQILLRFTLPNGSSKKVLLDAPISVIMDDIDHYITLPAYNAASCCNASSSSSSPSLALSSTNNCPPSKQGTPGPTAWKTRLLLSNQPLSPPPTTNDRPPAYDDIYPRISVNDEHDGTM